MLLWRIAAAANEISSCDESAYQNTCRKNKKGHDKVTHMSQDKDNNFLRSLVN
jgi:hypothetical protein